MLRAILAGAAGIGWAGLWAWGSKALPVAPTGEFEGLIVSLYAVGGFVGLGAICIWIITTPALDRILGDDGRFGGL